jgi:hypothetical protein
LEHSAFATSEFRCISKTAFSLFPSARLDTTSARFEGGRQE